MKKLILMTALLIATISVSAKQTQLEAENRIQSVSPQMISHFSDKILKDTYVSVVAVFTGGAWISQQVFVNVGGTEEAQNSFSFQLMGEVSKVEIYESHEDGTISFVITSNRGPWSNENDSFTQGYTDYLISVKKDPTSENGYATKATLIQQSYTFQK